MKTKRMRDVGFVVLAMIAGGIVWEVGGKVSADEEGRGPASREAFGGKEESAEFRASAEGLVKWFGHASTHEQLEIAKKLVALKDKGVITKMEKYLEAPERERRCNAAYVLAGLGDARGAEVIIREYQDKGERATEMKQSDGKPWPEGQIKQDRYYAAVLLGMLKQKEAVPALMEGTGEKDLCHVSAISLAQIGDRRAIPALRVMMTASPEQRLWAAYGLAAMGEADGFGVLEEIAVGDDENWSDRRHAVETLGKLGDACAVPMLLKALKDKHANVRVSAAEALGIIGDRGALAGLTEALGDKTMTEVHAPRMVAEEAQKAIDAIKKKQG